MINSWFAELGLSGWKGVIGALVLPPLPLIALMLLGCCAIYFLATPAAARLLTPLLLPSPPPFSLSEDEAPGRAGPHAASTAIVVLGAGRRPFSPEDGMANLKPATIERLRFGLWLSRQTGWPVGYTGGIGYAEELGPSEAEIASRIAASEFQHPLRWAEGRSRDTAENAALMVPLLREAGMQWIVLVTHDCTRRSACSPAPEPAASRAKRDHCKPSVCRLSRRWT